MDLDRFQGLAGLQPEGPPNGLNTNLTRPFEARLD